MSRILALIPAYQEAANITELVRRVQMFLPDVLVVDDGSKDETAQKAKEAGANVVVHSQNKGKGEAIRTGLRKMLEDAFDAVILLDGDLQHLPEEIPLFLKAFQQSNPNVIVGSRMTALETMPLVRKLTNQFMSWLISKACGRSLPDSQCGFRLLDKSSVELVLKNCFSSHYDFETEMLLVTARAGKQIAAVPITTVYRDGISKIRPLIDTARFIRLMLHYGIGSKGTSV